MRKAIALLACVFALSGAGARAVDIPQDDAGSGRDAPNAPDPSFVIEPGTYSGTLGVYPLDDDYYALSGRAGDSFHARVAGVLGCMRLLDEGGSQVASTCTGGTLELVGIATILPADGIYYLWYSYVGNPDPYFFSFALNGRAGEPTPWSSALGGAGGALARVAPASQDDEHVVIGVIDTGINPYHSFFKAVALTDHPSTWLSGFPGEAETVSLTLGAPSLSAALDADADTWAGVQRTTYDPDTDTFDTHLYTFPGTRVIGGVSFSEYQQPADIEPIPIFDHYGHGTHSAGLAAGANLPAADGNVLIVMIEVGAGDFDDGIRWAARQPWIDALSISLGNRANVPVPGSTLGIRTGAEWGTYEAAESGKPVFVASGNGFSGTGVPPDHCSTYTSPYTGPTWVTRIGAANADNGNPTWWHCLPVDVIGHTDVGSASHDSLNGFGNASGTSAATPNVAGHYARLLLQARRDGRPFDRLQVRDHLLRAAEPQAFQPGLRNDPSVEQGSPYDQGYGLVDAAALQRALESVAAGEPRSRPELDEWWAQDRRVRELLWHPETGALMRAIVDF